MSDRTEQYTELEFNIKTVLEFSKLPECEKITVSIVDFRNILVPELETENSGALKGDNNVSDEVLKKYIEITRAIRAFWFDNIDTHLLTIEKLSDQTLARRRAYERSRKGDGPLRTSDKAVIDKPEVKKSGEGDILSQLKNLKPEELAALVAALNK